jgi:ABC-type hemin transport system substrate-binding protein
MRAWLHVNRIAGWVGTVAVGVTGIIGCGGDSGPVAPAAAAVQQRIVSFSPAMTQMIADLGCGERLVAVGAYDAVAPAGTPVVGDLYRIDYEKLITLHPTDVVLQTTRQGTPARLTELAASQGWHVRQWPLETQADVLRALCDDLDTDAHDDSPDATRNTIGFMLDKPAAARALAQRIPYELDALARITAEEPAVVVVMLVGAAPLTAAGRRTLLGELLTVAGGVNALPDSQQRYPTIDRERLLDLRPAAVLLFRPRTDAAAKADAAAAPPADLALPESLHATVHVIDDPAALLPSSAMPRIAADVARKLHPKLRAKIDAALASSSAEPSKP